MVLLVVRCVPRRPCASFAAAGGGSAGLGGEEVAVAGGPSRTVSRMPEEKQDPANTQMFRAFVERGEQDTGRNGMRTALLLLAAAVLVALIVVVVVLAG